MNQPVKVFLSYSHKDDWLKQEFMTYVKPLEYKNLIKIWHDREIGAGASWAAEIDQNLEQAEIVIFLVSGAFIASDYCHSVEMQRSLERRKAQNAQVIPVLISPCSWQYTVLSELQIIPHEAKPVEDGSGNERQGMALRAKAWTQVVDEIARSATKIQQSNTQRAAPEVYPSY
jgi:TIR domain